LSFVFYGSYTVRPIKGSRQNRRRSDFAGKKSATDENGADGGGIRCWRRFWMLKLLTAKNRVKRKAGWQYYGLFFPENTVVSICLYVYNKTRKFLHDHLASIKAGENRNTIRALSLLEGELKVEMKCTVQL
jgi:hypothetical protein